MKKNVDILRKEPKRTYTLAEISEHQFFPWARNGRTLRKMLEADRKGPNILQSKITGTDNRRRYLVEARNITKYLSIYGSILTVTARKTKRHGTTPAK